MVKVVFLAGIICFLIPRFFFSQEVRTANSQLLGFTNGSSERQRGLERQFDGYLDRENLRAWMQRLTARPHHTGSTYDKENAEFIASQFKNWGYETTIEEFHVLFPTPKTRLLEMLEPEKFVPKLAEPVLPEDPTSNQTSEQLPIYNAYSIDGDVTAELVYVNYGMPKDYEELDQRGIDVKGKVVIARYGGGWRGIKPKVAAEHGAIGCIIYSDPRDDGYFQGDIYPKGAYRNEYGAQRGSVKDAPLYSGDPLTPFIGATKNARRLSLKEAKTLTKIPVLPISYADALPLLKTLGGPIAPESWRGALPTTYHLGPGPTKIHLKIEFNWDIVPIYNVIAKLKGYEYPDEWIIRGNHHDAWVNGADDPVSGLVAMMEEARAISELAKTGWTPNRTIIYAAWDAEEQGLLGSTEWAEMHADALKTKGVVYINSDSNGRGFLYVGGLHTLEKFVNQIAKDVTDPQTKVSVAERARAHIIVQGTSEEQKEVRDRDDLHIYALGSGSDYTPFIQHLGIASLNIGYGGEDGGGSYHSIYDSYAHYTRFGDPTFEYGVALAQTTGRAVLRLASAEILPFEFSNFAETVGKYVKEVSKLTDDMREETEELNRRIKERSLALAANPTQTYIVPKPKEPVPFLNFAPLQNAVTTLERSAKEYDQEMKNLKEKGGELVARQKKALNGILLKIEQASTRREGLPRRPWYRHQIYAPGMYTGYGVKTLPAVREAIEQRYWTEANEQIEVVAKVIEGFAREIDRAKAILKEGVK
ncbi:MAG: M28 family peptidase [Ignavibacteriae bacterium]|nr:M28 family peptidase [Ignavibacteriota bacterium]